MNKVQKYEHLYIKFCWGLITIGAILSIYFHTMGRALHLGIQNIFFEGALFLVAVLLNISKYPIVKKNLIDNNLISFSIRAFEVVLMTLLALYIGVWHWVYIAYIFNIFYLSVTKGAKLGLLLVSFILGIHLCVIYYIQVFYPQIEGGIIVNRFLERSFMLILLYILFAFFSFLCGKAYCYNAESELEKETLLDELEGKYSQLEDAQHEIKFQYSRLKDTYTKLEETNEKLEESNRKLTASIAEFYTLQQISQAISSIFDITVLLRYVNDIILGVMGVNQSTIILFDEKKARLKVHTTSIKKQSELITLNDYINNATLLQTLESGKPYIENSAHSSIYSFIQDREVGSFICIPLSTKAKKFGLVLIEHKFPDAFDEENVRLMDIIGRQVGIAMENAKLYEKMHELATIDGLTGVYNRLYFQETMEKELALANKNQYSLSLAIFDIDYFKKFNDTFGHLFGDKVLKMIADAIKKSIRSTDILARYGGEEFIILFPRTQLSEAFEKAEKLRKRIEKLLIQDNLITASVTVSFGISAFPDVARTEQELIRTADDALYEAKSLGRNCVRIANDNFNEIIGDFKGLELSN